MDILGKELAAAAPGFAEDPVFPDLTSGVTSPDEAALRLPRALDLIKRHPGAEGPQIMAARLLELMRQRENMLDTWMALTRRFPANPLALRMTLRWLRRERRQEEGRALIAARARDSADRAVLLAELGETGPAAEEFVAALAARPADHKLRAAFVRYLQAQGDLSRALDEAAPLREAARLPASTLALLEALDGAAGATGALDPALAEGRNPASAALHQSILWFGARDLPPSVSPHPGGIAFVTGTLGAGGAERQLTRIAIALHRARESGTSIGGFRLQGPVSLIITSVAKAAGNDFFLPEVMAAGLPLTVTSDLAPEPWEDIDLPAGPVRDLAPALPRNAAFGLQRLTGHFRRTRPEIAYIWQDGAVLVAALAALAAGVPRIVISLRGMPPNLRKNLAKDEFHGMYEALARVPGVTLSSNSRAAADAYEDWIGLTRGSILVVPNAVDPLPAEPEAKDLSAWTAFDKATGGAGPVLGGIFRFDPNKRPLGFIDCAAAALRRCRDLRVVLIGSGAELEAAERRAEELGIRDRVLFAGHSRSVGFWLSKMTVVALLSEFEGLPNVLIEAQVAGVPVISTPAGGATETFAPGRTGLVLSTAGEPVPEEFAALLEGIVGSPGRAAFMGHLAREWAKARFSLQPILLRTLGLLKPVPGPSGGIRPPALPRLVLGPERRTA
jgi:glycosyltransferase involved in cell wall biosynthesis